MATGSISSVMASPTTPETSQDTKPQRSHKRSQIEMVLNEINKLAENLTARERLDRRLQLPYIAMGYFNEKGGSLSLKEYGVHLTIPRGAIAPGCPQQVYIYVDPTAPPNDAVEPTEVALSQSVKCGPKGLSFTESVVLSFPHHAVLIGQRYDKLVVRMRHDDTQGRQWEDGNPALVTEKMVTVLIDNFNIFSLVNTPIPGSSKQLKVGAFGGVLDKRCRQYAFRVHVWNDDKHVEENVVQEEDNMESKKLDVFRNVEFFWKSGNLTVSVSDLEGGWAIQGATKQIIDEEKIRNNAKNSVTFHLIRQMMGSDDAGFRCIARTYQCSQTEDSREPFGVFLMICPKQSAPRFNLKRVMTEDVNCVARSPTEDSRNLECTLISPKQVKSEDKTFRMKEKNKVQAGVAWTTNGGTASMMASHTTRKTSKDTKVRTTQEPSHLQLVLHAVKLLTENQTAKERLDSRLQLPYIAMGYFNEKGGSLSLDEYGVHLTIPRGAIAPGPPQQVFIYVDPTAPPNDAVEPTEVALSQSVKCGPKELLFTENVVLSFPHHADLKSQRYDKLVVRKRHDDSRDGQWDDGNPALVTEEMVTVLIDHFCVFQLVGTPTPGSVKQLKVGAFGGLLDQGCSQYAFRVHVWDNEKKGVVKNVVEEEENMEAKQLDCFRNLQFFWGSGDLAVSVSDPEGGWAIRGGMTEQIINEKKIQVNDENSVTFDLKRQAMDSEDERLFCFAFTYQRSSEKSVKDQTTVCLSISPKQGNSTGFCRQRPGVPFTEGTSRRCNCHPREEAHCLCVDCKERIGIQLSKEELGEVNHIEYGGLSANAVYSLCFHLDDGNKWTKLVERISDWPGTHIKHAIESAKLRTKGVLKIFFANCRHNNIIDKKAIDLLVELLNKSMLTRAVEIIQGDIENHG